MRGMDQDFCVPHIALITDFVCEALVPSTPVPRPALKTFPVRFVPLIAVNDRAMRRKPGLSGQ